MNIVISFTDDTTGVSSSLSTGNERVGSGENLLLNAHSRDQVCLPEADSQPEIPGFGFPLETKGLSSNRTIVLRVLSTKILIPPNLPVK
ncbi:MAG: hypothetical protein PWQ46_1049 [Methanomicrobiaceae archaeon]|jgi:hypothetical protein|nr:hypothetical protein [Methanomicrobiaceae archaeon]